MLLAVEIIAVAFAIAYLLLAVRQSLWCWPAALISVLLSIWLFYTAKLYMEAALQGFYAAMAVYGWRQWRRGAVPGRPLPIVVWPLSRHAVAVAGILALTGGFGWVLSHGDAAFPYWDSFTTVAAVLATFMVAHKVLENWIYWFVIDTVSLFLYTARELYLYAGLFALYLVLIVVGFRAWRQTLRAQLPDPGYSTIGM
jgi:nicotinamide mononucleotide transporter